jgi:hypothetical protein
MEIVGGNLGSEGSARIKNRNLVLKTSLVHNISPEEVMDIDTQLIKRTFLQVVLRFISFFLLVFLFGILFQLTIGAAVGLVVNWLFEFGIQFETVQTYSWFAAIGFTMFYRARLSPNSIATVRLNNGKKVDLKCSQREVGLLMSFINS